MLMNGTEPRTTILGVFILQNKLFHSSSENILMYSTSTIALKSVSADTYMLSTFSSFPKAPIYSTAKQAPG